MAEVINMAVETAIQQKKIVLLDFTKAHPCKDYYDFYVARLSTTQISWRGQKLWELDLSCIEDPVLLRRIVGFIWYSLNPNRRSPKIFHEKTVLTMQYAVQTVSKEALASYQVFLEETQDCNQENFARNVRVTNRRFHRYCLDEDHRGNPYASDVWDLDEMHLAPERLNDALHHRHIFFNKVLREDNKALVKDYAKHLLTNTDNSVSTIIGKTIRVKDALNLVDKSYLDWNADDADLYARTITNGRLKKSSIALSIMYMEDFTEYLLLHDVIADSPIKQYHQLSNQGMYHYKETAPEKYVLTQIFNALGSFKRKNVVIWFLCMYCTGMRVSEACQLKKDCLERNGETFFIRFYQPKMKKEVTNVIPKALYEMIEEHRKTVTEKSEYLFPGQRFKRPMQRSTFYEHMREELSGHDIKNSDGSQYNFTPHSLRHLMAVRMRDEDIPFQYIVEQLHHDSPEMTMAYLEYVDRQKIAKMKNFINIHGDNAPLNTDIKVADDVEYAEYLRKFINAQMLPNGVCARPVKLGKCNHCNACLHCEDFRTSVAFLDVHKDQLSRLKRYMNIAKQNNLAIQLKEAEGISITLENIINVLGKEVSNGGS